MKPLLDPDFVDSARKDLKKNNPILLKKWHELQIQLVDAAESGAL